MLLNLGRRQYRATCSGYHRSRYTTLGAAKIGEVVGRESGSPASRIQEIEYRRRAEAICRMLVAQRRNTPLVCCRR